MNTRWTLAFLFWAAGACAQSKPTPFSLWAFPGVSWHSSHRMQFSGQYGLNPPLRMQAAYLQAFLKTGRHVTFNPAYLYLGRYGEGITTRHEHTFMNALIFSFAFRRWTIEDRNLVWNRFRQRAGDIHYYRNRFRVSFPMAGRSLVVKPYLFDEVFYWADRGRWSRNRIAAGISCDIRSRVNVDVFYAREQDRYLGPANLVFVMGTLTFASAERKEQGNRAPRE